jgi:NADH:ubiquinone oxidoreductase subunit F (NADH-binding)
MAGPGDELSPPTLATNVETLANVPRIIARGAAWFRTEGTEQSPGTMVVTITGDVQRAGVGEVIMGTPLREAIAEISGGPAPGHEIKAVLTGVSNRVITGDQLDVPVSYEGLASIGSGLGSAGFVVLDDRADMIAVAAGASRFLAVESCGQCTPCKQDGLVIADRLARLCANDATDADLNVLRSRLGTIADSARCSLATQHQIVVGSIVDRFAAEIATHAAGRAHAVEPMLVTELADIEGDEAVIDIREASKQPDWSYDTTYSGQAPADRWGDHREYFARR